MLSHKSIIPYGLFFRFHCFNIINKNLLSKSSSNAHNIIENPIDQLPSDAQNIYLVNYYYNYKYVMMSKGSHVNRDSSLRNA